jgi:hypothetical protein
VVSNAQLDGRSLSASSGFSLALLKIPGSDILQCALAEPSALLIRQNFPREALSYTEQSSIPLSTAFLAVS